MGSPLSYHKGLNGELITKNFMQFCVGRLECKALAFTSMVDEKH